MSCCLGRRHVVVAVAAVVDDDDDDHLTLVNTIAIHIGMLVPAAYRIHDESQVKKVVALLSYRSIHRSITLPKGILIIIVTFVPAPGAW